MSIAPKLQLIGPAVEHLGGEQDHSGARAEHRQAIAEQRLDVVEQPRRGQQPRHRRALAAGHHQRIDAVEITGLANLACCRAGGLEGSLMRDERALQCQHTDEPIGARQPAVMVTSRAPRTAD